MHHGPAALDARRSPRAGHGEPQHRPLHQARELCPKVLETLGVVRRGAEGPAAAPLPRRGAASGVPAPGDALRAGVKQPQHSPGQGVHPRRDGVSHFPGARALPDAGGCGQLPPQHPQGGLDGGIVVVVAVLVVVAVVVVVVVWALIRAMAAPAGVARRSVTPFAMSDVDVVSDAVVRPPAPVAALLVVALLLVLSLLVLVRGAVWRVQQGGRGPAWLLMRVVRALLLDIGPATVLAASANAHAAGSALSLGGGCGSRHPHRPVRAGRGPDRPREHARR